MIGHHRAWRKQGKPGLPNGPVVRKRQSGQRRIAGWHRSQAARPWRWLTGFLAAGAIAAWRHSGNNSAHSCADKLTWRGASLGPPTGACSPTGEATGLLSRAAKAMSCSRDISDRSVRVMTELWPLSRGQMLISETIREGFHLASARPSHSCKKCRPRASQGACQGLDVWPFRWRGIAPFCCKTVSVGRPLWPTAYKLCPPLTSMHCPVIQRASSEATKPTTSAMSAG